MEKAGDGPTSQLATPTIRVVSGLLLAPGSAATFLMGLRPSHVLRPEMWELPGGKVEPGEGPRTALRREWREEFPGFGDYLQVGELVATGTIHADLLVTLELYELTIVQNVLWDQMALLPTTMTAHVEVAWVPLDEAVRHRRCSPGFYAHYHFLSLWLSDRQRGVW